MKLRNKKTGEKATFVYLQHDYISPLVLTVDIDGEFKIFKYNSLSELNEDWEDYEDPKEHWCITMYGGITRIKDDEEPIDDLIEIGNYFNSKEDAYDALDKLKAWKRLKDNGFKFADFRRLNDCATIIRATHDESWGEIFDDLDICFGGEE